MSLSLSVDSEFLAPNIGFDTGNTFSLKPLCIFKKIIKITTVWPILKDAVELQTECYCDALFLRTVLKDTFSLSVGNFKMKSQSKKNS